MIARACDQVRACSAYAFDQAIESQVQSRSLANSIESHGRQVIPAFRRPYPGAYLAAKFNSETNLILFLTRLSFSCSLRAKLLRGVDVE